MLVIKEDCYNEETKHLGQVKAIVTHHLHEIESNLDEEKKEVYQSKKYIWDECQKLTMEELGSVLTQINVEINNTNDHIIKVLKYKKILDSAYFGRIDFKENENTTKVYIGISGLHENNENYIYDWRAPISSMFYDYGIGEASYEAPMGKIKGTIEKRRQYKIEKGQLKRVIESEINIDDEVLQEVLLNNSTDKMKNIVTTIQHEQNQVIRNTKDHYLIVQGIAGSGKTSVALHRIAYLLYKEKFLNYNNILIFSPNDVFSDYISEVLPELGEENVLNTTFSDLVKSYINRKCKIESFPQYLERQYNKKSNITKYSQKELDEFIKKYINNSLLKKTIVINETYFYYQELNDLINNKYQKFSFRERLEYVTAFICKRINIPFKKNQKRILKLLLNEMNSSLDALDIYKSFLEEKKISNNFKVINYEDLEIILYLYFEINGYPYNQNVKQIVIDEAQDYTKLQFYILKKIFPKAYFTILGDVNQAINPICSYNSLNEISEIFNNRFKYIELTKTYRSSAEIIAYSNQILEITNVCSVRKENGYPVLKRQGDSFNSLIDDINMMINNKMKTIAIITKNELDMEEIYNYLMKNEQEFKVVKNKIEKNAIAILPAYLAKGLEFDGVIVFNKIGNNYQENERKLFYVVCTRAQHQLIIYNN